MDASSPRCAVPGCRAVPSHGKPYCAEHVARHPYVAGLAARAAAIEAEVERLRCAGVPDPALVDPRGPMASEVVAHLRSSGPRTTDELANDLHVERFVLRAYVLALTAAGRVTCTRLSALREVVDAR